jgi:hypothetical protein
VLWRKPNEVLKSERFSLTGGANLAPQCDPNGPVPLPFDGPEVLTFLEVALVASTDFDLEELHRSVTGLRMYRPPKHALILQGRCSRRYRRRQIW